jgi:hypothetical protein
MAGPVDLSLAEAGDIGVCVDGCSAVLNSFDGIENWPVSWRHAGGFYFTTTMGGQPRRIVEDDDNNTIVRVLRQITPKA